MLPGVKDLGLENKLAWRPGRKTQKNLLKALLVEQTWGKNGGVGVEN